MRPYFEFSLLSSQTNWYFFSLHSHENKHFLYGFCLFCMSALHILSYVMLLKIIGNILLRLGMHVESALWCFAPNFMRGITEAILQRHKLRKTYTGMFAYMKNIALLSKYRYAHRILWQWLTGKSASLRYQFMWK